MRVHVVSLPHTLLTRDYDWCAYTAKVRRFVEMLARAGHEPIVYGPDVHEVVGALEYVTVVDYLDRALWFGATEWPRDRVFDKWSPSEPCWHAMNQRASTEIRKRWEHGDVLGLIGGLCQKPIADELADLGPLVVEWGIGYSGVLDNSHKVFESYAWAHHVAGLRQQDDISFFDTVIPNCFNPNEFRFREPDDFVLFMGRPTIRKGLPIVEEIAKRIDSPVLHAGQPGQTPIAGTDYLGIITGDTKADTLARARAVLVPTTYLEPFGGVAVEAMMSGTPVITTDWGAFTETVEQGVTGFRCRTLREFLDAVDASADLDRAVIRDRAIERFSTDEGSRLYSRYLERVSTLHGAGWYAGAE
jgi:hypothetical protein